MVHQSSGPKGQESDMTQYN